jgi:hypothetical protein
MNRAISMMIVAGLASVASAADSHYFTQGDRMYVTSNNGASTTLVNLTLNNAAGPTISSLAFDPSGNLWGGSTAGGNLYRINPATGAMTLSPIANLGGQSNTFDFRQNGNVLEAMIFTTFSGGRTDFQIRNAVTGAVISPATTVLSNTNPGIPASGYSGSGNTLFCFDGVSYNLRGLNLAAIGTPAVIGNTGITWSQAGGDFYNGQLWLATRIGSYNASNGQQNHGTSGFRFGTVNTTTGAFTQAFTVPEIAFGGGFGYAIIPSPGTAALLGLAGIAAGRRRR